MTLFHKAVVFYKICIDLFTYVLSLLSLPLTVTKLGEGDQG